MAHFLKFAEEDRMQNSLIFFADFKGQFLQKNCRLKKKDLRCVLGYEAYLEAGGRDRGSYKI